MGRFCILNCLQLTASALLGWWHRLWFGWSSVNKEPDDLRLHDGVPMGGRVGLSWINQNRLYMVLMAVSLPLNSLPPKEAKFNTIWCFQSLAKQNWKIGDKGPETGWAFGIYQIHHCLFCVQTNISFLCFMKIEMFILVSVDLCMFSVKRCLAWDGVLISSFHLHQFAYKNLLASGRCPRQTHTTCSTYVAKLVSLFEYFAKQWLSCWKKRHSGSHLEQLAGHLQLQLTAFVMLADLQPGQARCCWCLRPERINLMSNNSRQQSPDCYTKAVLLTQPCWTELKEAPKPEGPAVCVLQS